MRYKEKILILLMVMMIVLLSIGCSGGKQNIDIKNEPPPLDRSDVLMQEIEQLAQELKEGETAEITDKTVGIHNRKIGFRVMVYMAEEKAMADWCLNRVRAKVKDQEVYMVFQAPSYKIVVGNFLDFEAANQYRFILKQKGFNNTMVVRSEIWVGR